VRRELYGVLWVRPCEWELGTACMGPYIESCPWICYFSRGERVGRQGELLRIVMTMCQSHSMLSYFIQFRYLFRTLSTSPWLARLVKTLGNFPAPIAIALKYCTS
jgi:hypothetical protein